MLNCKNLDLVQIKCVDATAVYQVTQLNLTVGRTAAHKYIVSRCFFNNRI